MFNCSYLYIKIIIQFNLKTIIINILTHLNYYKIFFLKKNIN